MKMSLLKGMHRGSLGGLLVGAVMVACSQSPEPGSLAPQSVTGGPAEPGGETGQTAGPGTMPPPPLPAGTSEGEPRAAETAESPAPTGATRAGRTRGRASEGDPTVVRVGPSRPREPAGRRDLAALARAERERRRSAPEAVMVVTDENLAEMAEGGQVTVGTASKVPGAPPASSEGALTLEREDELYWRTRARDLRERLRDAHDAIPRLEQEADELRTEFYLEDDPIRRDRQIKPAWDKALEDLAEARREVDATRVELDDLMEEGRRAGALPGWLREGLELEPEIEGEEPSSPETEPGRGEIVTVEPEEPPGPPP